MFHGTYSMKLDAKFRLVLPAKFREELSAGVALVEGQEQCLVAYPFADYHAIAQRIPGGPLVRPEVRMFRRKFIGGMHHETPDKQGRITLPALMRLKAELVADVIVTGVGDCLEIWSPPLWELAEADASETMSNLPEDGLAGLSYTGFNE